MGGKNLEQRRVKTCGCLGVGREGFMTENCEDDEETAFCMFAFAFVHCSICVCLCVSFS